MAEVQGGLRVAYDDTDGVWDELADRKGYFALRGDGPKAEAGELNLWQIADRYGIDRVVTASEDNRVAYLEARVGELHNTIEEQRAELERWRTGQRRHSWPVIESVPDGLSYAAKLVREQGTEGGDEHDRLLREASARMKALHDAAKGLIADRDRERSSRQAWAEEAMRCDFFAERMTLAAAKHDEMLRFVARRYLADGSGANFRPSRCTGVSSDALAWYAVGIRIEPMPEEYPLDPSDLAACDRTYEMAPEFLRERMEPVLAKYRAAVAKKYPEVGSRPQCAVHPEGGGEIRAVPWTADDAAKFEADIRAVEGGGPTP